MQGHSQRYIVLYKDNETADENLISYFNFHFSINIKFKTPNNRISKLDRKIGKNGDTSKQKTEDNEGNEAFACRSLGENFQFFVKSRHSLWSFLGLQKISRYMPRWVSGSSERSMYLWSSRGSQIQEKRPKGQIKLLPEWSCIWHHSPVKKFDYFENQCIEFRNYQWVGFHCPSILSKIDYFGGLWNSQSAWWVLLNVKLDTYVCSILCVLLNKIII